MRVCDAITHCAEQDINLDGPPSNTVMVKACPSTTFSRLTRDIDRPVTLGLATIDRLVEGLPPSARRHRAWWANERSGTHHHARAWLRPGRRVLRVDVNAGIVEFSPGEREPIAAPWS